MATNGEEHKIEDESFFNFIEDHPVQWLIVIVCGIIANFMVILMKLLKFNLQTGVDFFIMMLALTQILIGIAAYIVYSSANSPTVLSCFMEKPVFNFTLTLFIYLIIALINTTKFFPDIGKCIAFKLTIVIIILTLIITYPYYDINVKEETINGETFKSCDISLGNYFVVAKFAALIVLLPIFNFLVPCFLFLRFTCSCLYISSTNDKYERKLLLYSMALGIYYCIEVAAAFVKKLLYENSTEDTLLHTSLIFTYTYLSLFFPLYNFLTYWKFVGLGEAHPDPPAPPRRCDLFYMQQRCNSYHI